MGFVKLISSFAENFIAPVPKCNSSSNITTCTASTAPLPIQQNHEVERRRALANAIFLSSSPSKAMLDSCGTVISSGNFKDNAPTTSRQGMDVKTAVAKSTSSQNNKPPTPPRKRRSSVFGYDDDEDNDMGTYHAAMRAYKANLGYQTSPSPTTTPRKSSSSAPGTTATRPATPEGEQQETAHRRTSTRRSPLMTTSGRPGNGLSAAGSPGSVPARPRTLLAGSSFSKGFILG